MTIQVEVSPEVEEQLAVEAKAQGLALEQVAGNLIEQALIPHENPSGLLTVDQFRAMLKALAIYSDHLPHIRTEDFTRESFYEGRE